MKKIVLLFVSVISAGLLLTSCNKDDDSSSSASVEGKWYFSKVGAVVSGNELLSDYLNECATKKDYVEFSSNGSYASVFNLEDCTGTDISVGTWSRTGDVITITETGQTPDSATILSLTSTTLKVSYTDTDGTYITVFTR